MTRRIRLSNAKGWRMPPNTVKVDRSTRWGNPWHLGKPGQIDLQIGGVKTRYHLARDLKATEAVEAYICWLIGYAIPGNLRPDTLTPEGNRALWAHMAARRLTIMHSHLHMLRGKDLACWCRLGTPCHADVLLAIANCDSGDVRNTLQSMRIT